MNCPKCEKKMSLVMMKYSREPYFMCDHCGYTPFGKPPPDDEILSIHSPDDLDETAGVKTATPSPEPPPVTSERVVPPSRLPTRRALGRWIAIFAIAIFLAIWIQSERPPKISAPEQMAEMPEEYSLTVPTPPLSPEEPTPVPAVAPTPSPSPKRTEVTTAPKPEAPAPRTGRRSRRSSYVPPDDWGSPKAILGGGSVISPATEADLMAKLLTSWNTIPERGANADWKFGKRGERICLWQSRDDVICLEPRGNAFVEVYVNGTGYSRTEALAIAKRTLLD